MSNNTDKYYYALGRRKTAVATVRLYEGEGISTVNGKPVEEQYKLPSEKFSIFMPLRATDNISKFYFSAQAKGGGKTGQLEAIRHGISRALVVFDETLKSELKKSGLMTRDPRMVERKKAGFKKARKSPQFSKR